MSGVEDACDGDLAILAGDAPAGGDGDVGMLQRQLVAALGAATFEKAHARLQNVVEEEDDDALVADIQSILGPKRLDKLPMILKLIFLEGGGGAGV